VIEDAEIVNQETGEVAIVARELPNLALQRIPDEVLAEAKQAATALQKVINSKPKPVRFGGEVYLEFEDWQTIGRFYGATARLVSTKFVQFGDVIGFEARSECVDQRTGNILSVAESMCLNDEPNWAGKPLYQLRSMAQTRSGSKCFRNVFSWVAVLGGYKPTPAEEMEGVIVKEPQAPIQEGIVSKVVFITEGTKKSGDTWKKWGITIGGTEYTTFSSTVFEIAEQALVKKIPVRILKAVQSKFGPNLEEIELEIQIEEPPNGR
jgi:hypothetical protein